MTSIDVFFLPTYSNSNLAHHKKGESLDSLRSSNTILSQLSLYSGPAKASDTAICYTLEQVLDNAFPSPYSREDFISFAKGEVGAQYQLDFLSMIELYVKAAMPIIPEYNADNLIGNDLTAEENAATQSSNDSSPTSIIKFENTGVVGTMTEDEYNQIYTNLQNQSIDILQKFVMKNAPCDISLPDTLREAIITNVQGSIHPESFNGAVKYIRRTLRNGVFIRFLKNNDASFSVPVEIPTYTIHQLISSEIPHPYSYEDFYDFLHLHNAENELQFLSSVWKYQMDAKKFHPISMTTAGLIKSTSIGSNSSLSSLQRGGLNSQTSKNQGLLKWTIKPSDIPPAQCPSDFNFNAFKKCIDELLSSLKFISSEFIQTDSPKQVNLPASIRKTVLSHIEKDICHPDILTPSYEYITETLRITYLANFLKRQSEGKRLSAILEASVPKYNLQQLLNKETQPPYSLDGIIVIKLDFHIFVKQNSADKKVKFLEAIKEYEDLAKQFYPGLVVEPEGKRISITSVENQIPSIPIPPLGMEIKVFTGHLRTMEKLIRVLKSDYIDHNDIALSSSIRDPIIAFIDNGNYNPIIFEIARDTVYDSVQSNELNEFIKKTYQDRLNAGLSLKLESDLKSKVDKLLLGELAPPFTYHSFFAFCNLQNQIQGVAFCKDVMNYLKEFSFLFPDSEGSTIFPSPVSPKGLSLVDYNQKLSSMALKYDTIFKTYLQITSDAKLELPESIWTPLYKNMEQKVYHPNIFTRAYDFYATNLQKNLWDNYTQYLGPEKKGKYAIPNHTVKQLALNEVPSPYSYQEYHCFLQTLLCEENLEFLQACYKYQDLAARLYPDHIIRLNNKVSLSECTIPPPVKRLTLTNEKFHEEVSECKKALDVIVDTYIRPESAKEVNLPVHVRKPFLLLHDKGVHHPDLINELMEHITNMLRLNTLKKFLKSASKNETKLFSDFPDGHEKFTIKQIVLNYVPKPYSQADFMEFLKKEHCEESLEFLISVIEYHKFSSKFFPYGFQQEAPILRKVSTASKASLTKSPSGGTRGQIPRPTAPLGFSPQHFEEAKKNMERMCKDIFKTYFATESAKEISIDEKVKNTISSELRSDNYHPEIWKPAFEVTTSLLRVNHLTKFLKQSPSMNFKESNI